MAEDGTAIAVLRIVAVADEDFTKVIGNFDEGHELIRDEQPSPVGTSKISVDHIVQVNFSVNAVVYKTAAIRRQLVILKNIGNTALVVGDPPNYFRIT